MGFVQFYFGLPIAMIIICATFIPIFHQQKFHGMNTSKTALTNTPGYWLQFCFWSGDWGQVSPFMPLRSYFPPSWAGTSPRSTSSRAVSWFCTPWVGYKSGSSKPKSSEMFVFFWAWQPSLPWPQKSFRNIHFYRCTPALRAWMAKMKLVDFLLM